jgi:hypothetical protein
MYVEMTFLSTMEEYGYDVPIRQIGIDFANSGYTHSKKFSRASILELRHNQQAVNDIDPARELIRNRIIPKLCRDRHLRLSFFVQWGD